MATQDAFDAQPSAFEDAVFQYCLDHILAACRREAARRRSEGRDERTVEIDRKQENLAEGEFLKK